MHMTRSYCAYSRLLAKLKELEPDVNDLRAIMTDGEPGLAKAIATFFNTETIHLRCLIHFGKNVKEKLRHLAITSGNQDYFLDKLFGSSISEGLLDAKDSEEFDGLLLAYKREMNEKEIAFTKTATPPFHNWIEGQGEVIKSSMILGVRLKAGLNKDESSTSNDAESINHMLKRAMNEKLSTEEFISLAKCLAENQKQEIIRAVLHKGDYRFLRNYSHLECSESKWMHSKSTGEK